MTTQFQFGPPEKPLLQSVPDGLDLFCRHHVRLVKLDPQTREALPRDQQRGLLGVMLRPVRRRDRVELLPQRPSGGTVQSSMTSRVREIWRDTAQERYIIETETGSLYHIVDEPLLVGPPAADPEHTIIQQDVRQDVRRVMEEGKQ